MNTTTPLRYPGGKQQLSGYVKTLITTNKLHDGVYVEPYAGGAGVALDLLFSEYVSFLYLNDLDANIYAFWWSVLNDSEELITRLRKTDATIDNWLIQHDILKNATIKTPLIDRGFATLFLNRCNRSGILSAGPIGGKNQLGKWKMDARYNRDDIAKRIERIVKYKSRIQISNKDSLEFMNGIKNEIQAFKSSFIYLDPPYYQKGQELYLNAYKPADHVKVASFMSEKYSDMNWIVSYDACLPIAKLYSSFRCTIQELNYSVTNHRKGRELVFYSQSLILPDGVKVVNPITMLENLGQQNVM